MWRVGGEWVGIPLAEERQGNGHPFLLYSHHPVLVSLGLPRGEEILTLAWDLNHARLHASTSRYVTTPSRDAPSIITREETTSRESSPTPASTSTTPSPADALQPLPPFTAYPLRLACGGVGVVGEGVLCKLMVSVSAGGDASNPLICFLTFFTIHHLGQNVRLSACLPPGTVGSIRNH